MQDKRESYDAHSQYFSVALYITFTVSAMSSSSFKDHLVFWNGEKMPIIGLGTWQVIIYNINKVLFKKIK